MATVKLGRIDNFSLGAKPGKSSLAALGMADWHVTETAAWIKNARRMGWTDARIVEHLTSDAGKDECPWGCTAALVEAAFAYINSGKFPAGTTCTTDACRTQAGPIPPSYSGPTKWGNVVLWGGVAAAGVWFLFFRK